MHFCLQVHGHWSVVVYKATWDILSISCKNKIITVSECLLAQVNSFINCLKPFTLNMSLRPLLSVQLQLVAIKAPSECYFFYWCGNYIIKRIKVFIQLLWGIRGRLTMEWILCFWWIFKWFLLYHFQGRDQLRSSRMYAQMPPPEPNVRSLLTVL